MCNGIKKMVKVLMDLRYHYQAGDSGQASGSVSPPSGFEKKITCFVTRNSFTHQSDRLPHIRGIYE